MINVANSQQEMPTKNASSLANGQETKANLSKSDWAKDIKRHNSLVREYEAMTSVQTELMEKIRQYKTMADPRTGNSNKIASPRRKPTLASTKTEQAAVRARLALREALEKLQKTSKEENKTPLQTWQRELRLLDTYLAKAKGKMSEIEARVLTKEPEDVHEAVSTLRFVTKVLAIGHKIEDGYLSHVLEDCADAISISNAPSLSVVK